MPILRILSAGAAQSVAERIADEFRRASGCEVQAAFGAVGAIRKRVEEGEPADVVILSAALIDELVASGHVAPGSRRDLGTVGTGVAVRAGAPVPEVATNAVLRERLLGATRIVCPDPAIATAGKIVVRALDILGIGEQTRHRLQFHPNGYAAMKELAANGGPLDIGITQTTEIRANPGVTYVGPLPDALQMKTVYSAGVAAAARNGEAARDFIARLTGPAARAVLEAAGYEFDR